MITVTGNGCFDGLHHGHMFYLGFCRARGDKLYIGINSDEYIRRKKRDVFVTAVERRQALIDLGFIEDVIIFNEDDPWEFIKKIHPDVHCIGQEYMGFAPEEEPCRKNNIKVVYVPRVGKWSTTSIKNKCT